MSYDPVQFRDVLACWTRSRLFGLFVCRCATLGRRVYLFPVLLGCSARNEKFAGILRLGRTATDEKRAC
jgi:hypothetical protein